MVSRRKLGNLRLLGVSVAKSQETQAKAIHKRGQGQLNTRTSVDSSKFVEEILGGAKKCVTQFKQSGDLF